MLREITFADSSYFEQYTLNPYNPDELYQKKGNYNLHDDIRQDDQVSACLKLKKFIVLNADWDIECEDEDVIEFIKYALTEGLDDIFQKKLYDILSALDYGFSVTEKVYSYVDTPEWGKKILLTRMKTRAPHTFEFHMDKQGNIEKLMQHIGTGNDIEVPMEKVIHYAYQKEFDNHYGKSEFTKGLYNAWWSKQAITKFLNIYLERFGMPTVVGTIPKSAPAQADRFLDVLKNIQAKTSITMPEGFDVKLLDGRAGSANDVYIQAINYYNLMIGRAMLIPDLMGIAGSETSGGSYALGKEQFDLFYTTIRFVRNELERLINREIITPMVAWNFGDKVKARFYFFESDPAQKTESAKLWIEAVKTGKIPVTNEQVNAFLAVVDMPEVTDEEFEEIEQKKEEVAAQIQGREPVEKGEEPVPGKPESKVERGKEHEPEESPTDKAEKKKFAFRRELTKYERRANMSAINTGQTELINKYITNLAGLFKLSINAMVDDIKRRRIIEKKRINLVNKVQFKYGAKLTQAVKDMMRAAYGLGKDTIPKKFDIVPPTGLDNEDVVGWINEHAIYTSTIEQEAVIKSIKGCLIDGIRNGSSINDVIKAVNEALKGYDITLPDRGPNRIEMMVRTDIAKAFNEARVQQFKTVEGDIAGYEFSAILDERTSDICEELDGKVFKPSDILGYNPPLHPYCRSMLLPIFVDDDLEKFDTLPNIESNGGWYQIAKEPKE